MIPQAEALYRLQEIDLNILRSSKRLQAIAAELEDDREVAQARQQVEQAQAALAPLRTRQRNLELEIQTNNGKSKASEDRLYSGAVKNPKELQDLQGEIAALKKRNAELEDQLLEVMMAVEGAEDALAAAEAELQAATTRWQDAHRSLLDEQQALETEVTALNARREAACQPISPANLKTYQAMRPRKAHQPVSALSGSSCSVCGVEQNRAVVMAVQRGDALINCDNCGRILVSIS